MRPDANSPFILSWLFYPLRHHFTSSNLPPLDEFETKEYGTEKHPRQLYTLPEFAEYVQYVLANSTCRCHLIGLSRLFSQPVDTLRTLNVQPRRNRWEKAIGVSTGSLHQIYCLALDALRLF